MSTKDKKKPVYHTANVETDDLADFQKWIKQVNQGIEDWTAYLYFKAKKESKTYAGAKQWLRKNRPEAPRSFHATGVESFGGVIQAMYDDATLQIHNEALNKEIKND